MGQLARMVRAKYPGAYDDLDDATLEAKVLAKYPGAYDDLIEPTTKKPVVAAAPPEKPLGFRELLAATPSIGERLAGGEGVVPIEQAKAAMQQAPAVLGAGGGFLGGMPGAAAGGALGGGLEGIARGQSPLAIGGTMARRGAEQGTLEGAGGLLAKGAGKTATYLMNRATTRISQKLAMDFPELSQTLIENALTVSEGGYKRAKGLLRAAKSKATAALRDAEKAGATVEVDVSPNIADSLKTVIIEQALKGGQVATPAGGPVTMATKRLPAQIQALLMKVDEAAETGAPMTLTPTQADFLKTQLQRESRNLYAGRAAAPSQGLKATPAEATLKADFAARLNAAIENVASGYKAANASAQPFIGATRGLQQAIRPSGNLLQAMVRPGVGAALGGAAGQQQGHPAAGAIIGGAMMSPRGLSMEAITLGNPAVQQFLRQLPRATRIALMKALATQPSPTTPPGSPLKP